MDFLDEKIEDQIKNIFPKIVFDLADVDIVNDPIRIIKQTQGNDGAIKIIDILSEYLNVNYFNKAVSGDVFYHFIPLKYAYNILIDKKIRLYNLNKYQKDDSREFSYFIDEMGIKLPEPVSQIKSIKDKIFIFSCTTDNKCNMHWQRFGATEKVICLKLKINFTDRKNNAIEIKRVVYEASLLRLFYFSRDLFLKQNQKLKIAGWSSFSKFMKRGSFKWEKEVRLCFDNIINDLENKFGKPSSKQDINCDNGDSYIELPLKNDYFELSIEEVQIREDNLQSDLNILCNLEGFILKNIK